MPSGPTAAASVPANSPAPQNRSSATSPGRGRSTSSTAALSASAAPGCTCQNAPALTRQDRPAACWRRDPRPLSVVSLPPRPAASTVSASPPSPLSSAPGAPGAPGAPALGGTGATITARSPDAGDTTTSTDRAGAQSRPVTARARTSGWAIGQSPTSTTSWDRCASSPAVPPAPTENLTLVRQPSPSSSPATGSTVTSRSSPAMRLSCSRTTSALNRRWAARSACCQSQPPQPPGWACGHRGATRSAEACSTSTASARANEAVASVTLARTRSPGRACRTNTTRPSLSLATHQPPCATPDTSRSSTSTVAPASITLPAGSAGPGAAPESLMACPSEPVCRPGVMCAQWGDYRVGQRIHWRRPCIS